MNLKTALALSVPFVMAATAQAQIEVRFTGSTAFRGEVYRTIRSMYDPSFSENTDSSNPAGATRMTWSGTMTPLFGTNNVIVRASWSGSVDGVQTVAQGLNKTFLASATTGVTNLVSLGANFAMADNIQGNTLFTSPVLEDTTVGVVPFVWARSVATPATVDNVSMNVARGIWGLGYLPLSQFTGVAADSAKLVNIAGRDTGSGTRVVTLSETQYGVFTPTTHRKLNLTDGTTGTTFVDDLVGFASGGSLRALLNQASTTEYAIGYLGLGDANALTSPSAQFLKYNGVAYSAEAVRNGQYTFWSYEHVMNRSGLTTQLATFRGTPGIVNTNAFLAKIDLELATSAAGIQLSSMKVTRAVEGGPVTP